MNLEEQISQINNPQEFTRLCNTVLTALFPNDYQVIDGTRSDEGNDGYLTAQKRIFAIYCPIKPEQKKDSHYLSKIKSDLKKAANLRDCGKYRIVNWTFLTPRKLSSKVISKMYEEAMSLNLNASHLESTFLSNNLKRYPELLKDFSYLTQSNLEEKIDQVLVFLRNRDKKEILEDSDIDKNLIVRGETIDREELKKLLELRKQGKSKTAKSKLKSIYYQTSDNLVKINSIIGILETFMPKDDDVDDYIGLCDEGIELSKLLKVNSARAYLTAKKGFLLSFKSAELDLDSVFRIRLSNASGFPLVSEDEINSIVKQIQQLEDEYNKCFEAAFNISKDKKDFSMLATVFIIMGSAAGYRAQGYNQIGHQNLASYNIQLCRKSFFAAKDIYSYLNDEHSKGYVFLNLANQIRFFNEQKEALELTKNALTIAETFSDKVLLSTAKQLKERLESGEIPNYFS